MYRRPICGRRCAALAGVLYDIASAHKIPYLLILEEADKFIPQAKESIKKIEEISRRGRKRGLGLLVATQRPSFVTKNVLSQCNNQVIGKLSIENDLRAVDLFFGSRRRLEELATLQPGEFFVMGGFARKKTRIRFAGRETEHRGETPELSRRKGGRPSHGHGHGSPPAPCRIPVAGCRCGGCHGSSQASRPTRTCTRHHPQRGDCHRRETAQEGVDPRPRERTAWSPPISSPGLSPGWR